MNHTHRRVVIGYVHPADHVASTFHHSLMGVVLYDRQHGQHIADVMPHASGALIAGPRNQVVWRFLNSSTADWLLWLDADMSFTETLVEDLLEVAHPEDRPIVSGLYFGQRTPEDEDGNDIIGPGFDVDYEVYPHVYVLGKDGLMRQASEYPRDDIVQVNGVGCGCLLAHRQVYRRILERPDNQHPYPWFRESLNQGYVMSEDLTFSVLAQSCGFPLHLATMIKLGHWKGRAINERTFERQEERRRVPV